MCESALEYLESPDQRNATSQSIVLGFVCVYRSCLRGASLCIVWPRSWPCRCDTTPPTNTSNNSLTRALSLALLLLRHSLVRHPRLTYLLVEQFHRVATQPYNGASPKSSGLGVSTRAYLSLSPLPLEQQQHRTNETKKSIESNKKDRKNRCVPRSIAQIARSTATLRVSVSFLLRRLCCFFCCCCWLVASSRSLARSFGSRLVVAFALIAAVPRRYLAGDRTLVARRCSAVISLARLESLFAKGV